MQLKIYSYKSMSKMSLFGDIKMWVCIKTTTLIFYIKNNILETMI